MGDLWMNPASFLPGTSFLVELGVLLAAWRGNRRGVKKCSGLLQKFMV